MADQEECWSRVAKVYEKEFIDPYRPEVVRPVHRILRAFARRGCKSVADLGCGIGPLLPFLSEHFEAVWGVDFASAMLERARVTAPGCLLLHRSLLDLTPLYGQLDVAVTINSMVMPSVSDQERALSEIHRCLKPNGYVVAVLPAMDGVHYLTMLLVDRARDAGMPLEAARKNAAKLNDLDAYDFAFGQFRFEGIEQHFWQPFEIRHRFKRAGLRVVLLRKLRLAWRQFAGWRELQKHPAPWDWLVIARRA
jgi:SAM-dependent methyltransferase